MARDNPGAVLARPYHKGVRLVGHSDVWGRDSNVQLAWVDDCAYIASSAPSFLGWGETAGEETYGVAVIDVAQPRSPRMVGVLRDRGSLYSAEALHAVEAADRRVLVAGTYEGGTGEGQSGWISIYDAADCAAPRLAAEYRVPGKIHALTLAPGGQRVYATTIEPFAGKGGIHVLDISDLGQPRYLGRFGVTGPDGRTHDFATHEISLSADETRIYAGVLASTGGDLNHGIPLLPPSAASLGPDAGGVYILDNSDIVNGRPDPALRLIGTAAHGGWHSVMPANIGGKPYLVAGGELGACPGAWPKFIDISDEANPVVAGEFRLAMNRPENCPGWSEAEAATGGIVGDAGTATLHFNDVDDPRSTRFGLFQFMWAGLRVVDLADPTNPVEIGYYKPGDACGGHVRYRAQSGHIWFTCGRSGFYVVELTQPPLR